MSVTPVRLPLRCTRRAAMALLALAAGCSTSTPKEVEMGQQASAQFNAQLPMVRDPELNRYINVLGDSIAGMADTRDLEWHFYIVDSPEINAFALPGGYVFVNRGLIEKADSLDELAGVLGHEIGHVTQRHTVKLQQKEQVANVGIALACILTRVCNNAATGTAIGAAAGGTFAKFSRDAEHEADSVGMIYVTRARIDPRGMTSMFEKLLAERKRHPDATEAFFQTHPLEEDRILFTIHTIDGMDRQQLDQLTRDTPNFQRFKARVQALPPSPPQPGR